MIGSGHAQAASRLVPLLMAALAMATTGCAGGSITQTAARTLQFVHEDPARLTVEYGQASMINYLEQVESTPGELTDLDGAPDPQTLTSLVAVLQPAVQDLRSACLLP